MKKKYGFQIVNSGEKAIVYSLEGAARLVEGPQRLYLWREKFELLREYTASQAEYLAVKYRNGSVDHINGPCSMYRNPVEHDKITVCKAITLDAHEVVVIYQHNNGSAASEKTVDRYLLYGPKRFVPAHNEWLHKFKWHGVDPNNKTKYIPDSNIFTKLKLTPDQFYYNVDEIRTSDNGLIRVKLMVFHEIHDVETMLGATQDPIGDIISCINADVTTFASMRTYAEFVEQSCLLNELSNYKYLTTQCKTMGVRVTKIVFRGYFAAPKIQQMHDESINKRTNLQQAYEKEEQKQALKDMELSSEQERLNLSQKLELSQLHQKNKIDRQKRLHDLQLDMARQTESVKQLKEEAENELRLEQAALEAEITHLTQLKSMGVDLTQHLLNSAAMPEKVTKIVPGGNSNPNIHFHIGTDNKAGAGAQ